MLNHADTQSKLATLVKLRRKELKAIAEAWLAIGATSFGLRTDSGYVYAVPETPVASGHDLSAPFKYGVGQAGYVTVDIVNTSENLIRLQTDAMMIGNMLTVEQDLETMTQELIAHQDQILALYDLNRSLRSYFDVVESLSALANNSRRLTNSETAFVLLELDGEIKIERSGDHLFPSPFLQSLLEDVRATGRHFLTNSQRLNKAPINLLCVPIQVGGVIAGVLIFIKSVTFISPDIKLSESLCEQAGAHIENVLLHQDSVEQAKLQTEVELAQQVQARLLPPEPPKVAGIDLYGGSVAASEVGGDFYDFITHPDRPLLFTVGDVAGKGLSAAMVMTMTRTAMRSVANIQGINTPEEVMYRVNEDLYDDFTEIGVFTTAFIGQYVQGSDELIFANAGHSPVVYVQPGQPARILQADGTALGVLPTSLCKDQVLPMPEGTVLIIMTDGFPEAENPDGEMFGYEQLLRLVEDTAHQSVKDIAETLFETVRFFQAGKAQSDDQTVIVVKRVP